MYNPYKKQRYFYISGLSLGHPTCIFHLEPMSIWMSTFPVLNNHKQLVPPYLLDSTEAGEFVVMVFRSISYGAFVRLISTGHPLETVTVGSLFLCSSLPYPTVN